MNSEKVQQFYPLVEKFKEEDRDAATDGLIEACDSLEGVLDEEAFIYSAMSNSVENAKRDSRRQKGELDMNRKSSSIEQREYPVSLPTTNGRRVAKKRGNFESFYANWLGEHGLADSVHIRRTAELDWDKCKVIAPSLKVVSLSDPIPGVANTPFFGENTEIVYGDTIAVDAPSPDELAELNERREELAGLEFIKNEGFKKLLLAFVEPGVPSSESKLKAAYVQAILWIIANKHTDDPRFNVVDLRKLCEMCGIKFESVRRLEPAEAENKLLKFELDKNVYTPGRVTF